MVGLKNTNGALSLQSPGKPWVQTLNASSHVVKIVQLFLEIYINRDSKYTWFAMRTNAFCAAKLLTVQANLLTVWYKVGDDTPCTVIFIIVQ